jgi:ADP-ribosyl-[dinitrogen reductase] hydrolase
MSKINASRIESTLLLGAVGDALGAPVEFHKAQTIEATFGIEAPEDLAYADEPPARFTDDTQMTLFMAEGLKRAIKRGVARDRDRFRHEASRSLVHWLATQDRTVLAAIDDGSDSDLLDVEELHVQRAPGNTCLSSCWHIHGGGALPDVDNRINDSKGCGAVMRSAPYGLWANSANEAFWWARDAGVLTHCHPSGYLSAAYFAAMIFELAHGADFDVAMEVADQILAEENGAEETRRAVAAAREVTGDGELTFQQMTTLGEGWVGEEALAVALAVARTTDPSNPNSIRQSLWMAARHDGDTDSTAAMAGNLIGAICAPEAMPDRWIEQIEMRRLFG